jgi:hypothetical protein
VLSKNVWADRAAVTGDWRKLHTEKVHDFCYTPNIIGAWSGVVVKALRY